MKLGFLFPTMTARVFATLFLGMVISAGLALTLSTIEKNAQVRGLAAAQLTDLVVNFISYHRSSSPLMREEIIRTGVPQIRPLQKPPGALTPDPNLEQTMRARVGERLVSIGATDLDVCQFTPGRIRRPVGCWVIELELADGSHVVRALSARSDETNPLEAFSPYYLIVLLVGSLAFAFLIARMVTAPLKVLSRAASAVGPDIENVTLPQGGPIEVRNAATAFASMRQRIRAHVQERTRMLAAIAHDLQTPLTRMRLRVENVDDPTLRRGLFADLGAMEALVREGLELARSADADEPFAVLNLDSLLQSLAQDATDAGQSVRFSSGCGAHVRVRPQSLQRCISNLVDNALKFAGSAEVSSSVGDRGIVVSIRDFGDGIPESNIATVMDPFVRGETSRSRKTGGVGLGLTIAQILADKNESSISLRNHPDGGLEATIAYLSTVKGRRLQPAG